MSRRPQRVVRALQKPLGPCLLLRAAFRGLRDAHLMKPPSQDTYPAVFQLRWALCAALLLFKGRFSNRLDGCVGI